MLTTILVVALVGALASGACLYAYAGARGNAKIVVWTLFAVSCAVLAVTLIAGYFRFILGDIPLLDGR